MHSCQSPEKDSITLKSPEGTHQINIYLDASGRPGYQVLRNGKTVIDSSGLGFEFVDQPALIRGLRWVESKERSEDETWEMPWGEVNRYQRLNGDIRQARITAHETQHLQSR